MRYLTILYGFVTYLMAIGTILYGIPWLGNFWLPETIDSGVRLPASKAWLINTAIIALFAVQHTVQARPWFKERFIKIFSQATERTTYVFFSNVGFIIMYAFWEPIDGHLWLVTNPVGVTLLWSLFGLGWVIAFIAIFIKNHFHFLGLRQTVLNFQGKEITPEKLKTSILYNFVRHPMYFGFLLAYWATPVMSVGHFSFALLMTIYTLVGIQFEEALLKKYAGKSYDEYRAKTPMLIPFTKLGIHSLN